MSIASYSELKSAIYKWLVKDSTDPYFDSDMMDNIIFMAESELNRRLRVRQMRTTANVSITANDNTASLPADFLQAYSVHLTSPVIEVQSASEGYFTRSGLYETVAIPQFFFVRADEIVFGPIPASDYTAIVEYYKKITGLSSSQTTNDILTAFPDLYLFMCLKHAYIAGQDVEREAVYEQRIMAIINNVNTMDKNASISKGARGVSRKIG